MVPPFENRNCPVCGERIKPNWSFCPACEASLGPFVCPLCGLPVKETWKRCPECETLLICRGCNRRLTAAAADCPICGPIGPPSPKKHAGYIEPLTGMEFVFVPEGTFMMGDTFNEGLTNEKPVHPVRLEAFYIATYAVTQAQWKCLMPDNPSHFKDQRHPVEQVSWHLAQDFIDQLNRRSDGRQRFCLPTEAQWEYAARSGGRQELYAGSNNADAVAWYEKNSAGRTQAVGQLNPNSLGIYDMSGNVWEWCRDAFRSDAYEIHQPHNPFCPDGTSDRVIRGGSYNLDAWSVRCARRFSLAADYYAPGLGLRLVTG
jgi:formylglycine-generating enzyme required for sulfatase activity